MHLPNKQLSLVCYRVKIPPLTLHLFMTVLGLHCYMWAFSSCSKQGYSKVGLCMLLIAVASFVAEHGSGAHKLQEWWHMGLVAPGHVESFRTRD